MLYTHPALVEPYRGNLGGGSYDHNYNWFDLINSQTEPYDDLGISSYSAGIMVGDDGGANQIGVAPGAHWIAVKACNSSGICNTADLHAALDWMLAPTDLGGSNPDPNKRPHIGMNIWGGSGCDPEFQADLIAWQAADILPVFPPGSGGPGCSTIGAPADLPEAFCAGATDSSDVIGPFSARGPSCWGPIKPDVAAPGVSVRSSWNNNDYVTLNSTTASSAHVAGTAALVRSADPALGVLEVRTIVKETALCIEDLSCGGDPCPGCNNVYGCGRIDAFEAVSYALSGPAYDIPWLSEDPISGTLGPGEGMAIDVVFDSAGLTPSVYMGLLDVASNDPANPHVSVPVTLTVVQSCDPVIGADFAWDPLTPTVGQIVTFTASATGTEPIAYNWEFGNGDFESGNPVSHAYTMAGAYTVILTATNPCSQVIVTHTVTVLSICEPVQEAAFSWLPLTPTVGEEVAFSGYATGTEPITFSWDWGDGHTGSGAMVTHTYTTTGDYLVVMTATNECGEEAITHTLTILPCTPVTATDFVWTPLTPTAGLPVTFTASASGTLPIDFTWDWGDGMTDTGVMATHVFTPAGAYTVTLTAANECSEQSAAHTIIVLPALPPCEPVTGTDFAWTPLTPTAGLPVTFTASASGTTPINYSWRLEAGQMEVGNPISHVFSMTGMYTVTLTATNACGEATTHRTLTVLAPPPEVYYIYLPLVTKNYSP